MCRSELFASVRTTSISLRLSIAVVLPAPMGPAKRMTCSATRLPSQPAAQSRKEALPLRRRSLRSDLGGGRGRRAGEDAHEAERIDESLGFHHLNTGEGGQFGGAHVGVAEPGHHLHLLHGVAVPRQVGPAGQAVSLLWREPVGAGATE